MPQPEQAMSGSGEVKNPPRGTAVFECPSCHKPIAVPLDFFPNNVQQVIPQRPKLRCDGLYGGCSWQGPSSEARLIGMNSEHEWGKF